MLASQVFGGFIDALKDFLNTNVWYFLQGKWEVPLPKVRAQGETEVLKVIKTGKRQKKAWKRMVTKVCFVGDGFTRKPPKYERFIRPMVRRKTLSVIFSPLNRRMTSGLNFLARCSPSGFAFQEGSRHASRAEGHVLPPHPGREEEPVVAALHLPGRHH